MNTQWKSSRPVLNQMKSSETLMLQRRDPASGPQDSLPALLLKLFSWKSGSVKHRQELLSLSRTAVQRMRSLGTSQRNDPKNGLAASPRWEEKTQWDLGGVAVGARHSCVTADHYSQSSVCAAFCPCNYRERVPRRWLGVKEERGSSPEQRCGLRKAFCGRWFTLTPVLVWWYVFPEMSQALYQVPIPFFGKISNRLSQAKISLVSREIWQGQVSDILSLRSGWGMTGASLHLYSCIWAHRWKGVGNSVVFVPYRSDWAIPEQPTSLLTRSLAHAKFFLCYLGVLCLQSAFRHYQTGEWEGAVQGREGRVSWSGY